MRLIALILTVVVSGASDVAAAQAPSAREASPSAQQDTRTNAASLNLPVSIDRIREALQQPPVQPLRGLDEQPQFRVEIQERLKIDELLKNLKFESGPVVAGGPYAYEQQRLLFPSVDNPLVQPYAAFSQTQLVVIAAEALGENYVIQKVADGLRAMRRSAAEEAAREEVEAAIAEYCGAQENHGAGIRICETRTPDKP